MAGEAAEEEAHQLLGPDTAASDRLAFAVSKDTDAKSSGHRSARRALQASGMRARNVLWQERRSRRLISLRASQ